MRLTDLALVQGSAVTRATLRRWEAAPWPVLRGWVAGSLAVAVALLASVWVLARGMTPDTTPVAVIGVNAQPRLGHVTFLVFRNSLVLALHSLSCLAGYLARSEMPAEASRYRGWVRALHDRAGALAIGFVSAATLFSLATQAYVIGSTASTVSAQLGIAPARLLVALLPHALLELWALFLPLAAWLIASRRDRWDELLAATVVTVAIAIPALILAALVEVYISPHLLAALLR